MDKTISWIKKSGFLYARFYCIETQKAEKINFFRKTDFFFRNKKSPTNYIKIINFSDSKCNID